ncbi:MAG: butyrate kinase [Ruminococcaceae bacterium]|nr:butyrate kinase [Oscillospiraceae bacterium]
MSCYILVINPGSTSTKVGVFDGETPVFEQTLRHSAEELAQFATIPNQLNFRKQLILDAMVQHGFDIHNLAAVTGRGGPVKPLLSGTYNINEDMLAECRNPKRGHHAACLGAMIAHEIAGSLGVPSFIVDPPVVDERQKIALYTGHPMFERISIFHALNQKAVAKRHAKSLGKRYEDLNLVVCHMGGGISIGAHCKGRVIDVNNSLNGDGPFSPDRSGTLPMIDIIKLCFSGEYTQAEVEKIVCGNGGLLAYTGTTNMIELTERAKTEEKIAEVLAAFHYQIAKEIGAMAVALGGQVDGILLTGGIAYGKETVEAIRAQVEWIAPVTAYPGEDELLALAQGTLRVLQGEEEAKEY